MEPGQTLLQYRLMEQIGEGGMGVVWKALDTRLNREVAIKLLPPAFAQDADRLARFQREARLLASLSHPNIATLHGLHEAEGGADQQGPWRFLVMELVQGQDLSSRLQNGALPVHDALVVTAQVARALEAAHASGVVHRDLKPANVVLTAGDKAKVLDFGLAKALDPDAASGSSSGGKNLSLSPTITSMGTVAGVILGTAAYMSPEQARGKPVDRRADLWSFGCLLYECLTGIQLFRGETVSDSLAAILRKEVDFSALPADTPPLVRVLVQRCLTRDPEKRLQDAGDARLELEQALEDPTGNSLGLKSSAGEHPASRSGAGGRWIPWVVALVALLGAGYLAVRDPAPEITAAVSRHVTIPVPGPTEFGALQAAPPTISPDGRHVVFSVTPSSGQSILWVRPLDSFEGRYLPGTEGAEFSFWSPDSRHIGFFAGGRLKRIEVNTSQVQTIGTAAVASARGGAWHANGMILYVPNTNTSIHLIEPSGGPSRPITTLEEDVPDVSHRWPVFLPDGEHFLYVMWTNDLRVQGERAGVYLASIDGEPPPRKILPDASSVAYVSPGQLLVMRGENLVAVPFDPIAGEVTGHPTVITSDVLYNRATGHAAFAASQERTLVYASGEAFLATTPIWYDREGERSPVNLEPAPYNKIRLAPGADRAVATMPSPNGDNELWILDLSRGIRTRLFQAPWASDDPVWSRDGSKLIYTSQETGTLDLYTRSADGSGEAELVFADRYDKAIMDWSPDGQLVAYWSVGAESPTPDIWLFSMEDRTSTLFAGGEPAYTSARFSADGQWLAFASDESGRTEVLVHAIERDGGLRAGARWQVSTAGGDCPHWNDDGSEIVYIDPDRRVMAVRVEKRQDRLVFAAPVQLFEVDEAILAADITGDHQRFLLATREEEQNSQPVRVILNWDAALGTP